MKSKDQTPSSASQASCLHWQQLSLFELQDMQSSSQKEASSGYSRSTGPSKASRRNGQVTFCRLTVAVNDNGKPIGQDHRNARYLDEDVEKAIELRAEGYTYQQISRMLDMPVRTLRGYLDGSARHQSITCFKTIMSKKWETSRPQSSRSSWLST